MSSDPDDAFADAAEALYALPPSAFTAERNARAKAARADGDRDLAARITALPRASASAWLLDALVREAGDDLEQVLQLGAALREAQSGTDRDRLRELGIARRDLLAEVADRAADRAQEAGQRVSAAALEELQQTLQAAMVDDDAAAAVRTGRLVRGLQADGLEPVDLTNALGGPGRLTPAPRQTAPHPHRVRAGGPDSDAEARRARQRRDAEQHAADAERRARRARTEAEDAATDAADAEQQVRLQEQAAQDLRARLDALRAALHEAEQQLTEAQRTAAEAQRTADRTSRDADEARDEAEAATARLRDLQGD